jgi:uncharacterized protein YdhG (YjbR/CyaY superfamily)
MKKTMHPEVEQYFNNLPSATRKLLDKVRETILKSAPGAEEKMSYGIPTVTLNGNLVHYAAFKNHIGFYPGPKGIEMFQEKISEYKSSKGSIQFPISAPIPYLLIKEIVEFRVKENTAKPTSPRARS